jgi:hypothetical protein
MEMMEIREGIEAVARSRDAEGLGTWRKWASEQRGGVRREGDEAV